MTRLGTRSVGPSSRHRSTRSGRPRALEYSDGLDVGPTTRPTADRVLHGTLARPLLRRGDADQVAGSARAPASSARTVTSAPINPLRPTARSRVLVRPRGGQRNAASGRSSTPLHARTSAPPAGRRPVRSPGGRRRSAVTSAWINLLRPTARTRVPVRARRRPHDATDGRSSTPRHARASTPPAGRRRSGRGVGAGPGQQCPDRHLRTDQPAQADRAQSSTRTAPRWSTRRCQRPIEYSTARSGGRPGQTHAGQFAGSARASASSVRAVAATPAAPDSRQAALKAPATATAVAPAASHSPTLPGATPPVGT